MKELYSIINNKEIKTNDKLEILNPVDGKPIGSVSALKKEDIDNAYKVARDSQELWESKSLLNRIEIVKVFRDEILKNKETFAELMVLEIAKSKKDALSEVDRTIEYMDYTFEEAKRLNPLALSGEELGVQNKIGIFSRVAKGVVCAISPFNYPINLSISKIAPALVTGNTVVFKPATAGSLTGAFLGKIWMDAKLPAGVFNVVTGKGKDIGDFITSNKNIDMISFTGSANIGNRIKSQASSTDLVLELGGKDPAFVLDDLDLEKYASEIISGALSYSGQRCTAIKRVFVNNKIADKLVPILKEKISKLTVGMPSDNAFITPVIDSNSADYIMGLIEDAKAKKAKIIIGDKRENNLIYPTLIDYVSEDCRVAWEEPFGPILPIIRVESIEKMIELSNKSEFGLQASIFSQNIAEAIRISKKIKTGTVNINSKSQRGPDSFPFMGIKNSGEGVQGIRESLISMTRYQGLVINY